jgi:hypothetical protein
LFFLDSADNSVNVVNLTTLAETKIVVGLGIIHPTSRSPEIFRPSCPAQLPPFVDPMNRHSIPAANPTP